MNKIQISNEELNKILLEDFGKRGFIAAAGRVPFILKWMLKRELPLPKNIKEIESIIESCNYEELYNKLHHDRMLDNKGKWYYDCCLIVICYFRLDKDDEAGQLIEAQNHITYSLPEIILNIAQKLEVQYIPKNTINKI